MVSAPTGPRFAAVYIRVSTDEQTELSPESQLEKVREYAQRNSMIILEDHIYIDAGISGKSAQRRPQFIARNQEESIFYKSVLRSKCGVDVVSISEPLIGGHFGTLIERIIEWMDEFYSIRLGEEVKRSMEVNARRGKLQATPSVGYRVENGALVPQEQEAELVRWIFDSFVSGKGLYPIARELNAMGVRTHRGNPFENRTVEYIIRNPVYIGKLRWNPAGRTRRNFFDENIITADSSHPPLISLETWEAAQQRMDAIKAQWGYKARPSSELKHWLSGLIRCAACDSTMIFTAPHYYKCSSYAKGRCTHSQHISAELLAQALIDKLTEDAQTADELAYEVSYSPRSGGMDIARLEASQKTLLTKKQRLQEAYLSGVLDLADFAAAKGRLEADMAQVEQEIRSFRQRTDQLAVKKALQAAIADTLATLSSPDATREQKNSAARSIIDHCSFDRATSTLTITYRLTL